MTELSDEVEERVARAIGTTLHACGTFKEGYDSAWTQGPSLLAARAAIAAYEAKGDVVLDEG